MSNPFQIKEKAGRRISVSPIVNSLREAVYEWRKKDYDSASETTKSLLHFWFEEEHKDFQYYFAQREAIETLIYLYEVEGLRNFFDIWRKFDTAQKIDPRAAEEVCSRYVFKMATGSGKTKVMSLAIVWSYFHKLREPDSPLAKNFVLIAPNIIVFERLKEDFADNKIFNSDPLIPPSWISDWNVKVLLQEEFATANPDGNIYLTNIHRLYEKKEDEEENPIIDLIGKKPSGAIEVSNKGLIHQILSHRDLMVLNDEAHHIHDEQLAWYQTIVNLQSQMKENNKVGVAAQLDFTATPKRQTGSMFPQVVVDYSLAEAIEDAIVKRPILPDEKSTKDFRETPTDNAAMRYKPWIDLGVSRWQKYYSLLSKTGKKPILFVMADDTTSAKQIQEYLEDHFKDLKGKILELHIKVNRSGDISEVKSNLEYLKQLREAARKIDSNENPYRAIVSVLMLREGWDVRNVTVIVGLRPYTADANILPEQTIGRGLRRMDARNLNWCEEVDIIGTPAFEEFIRQLEKEQVEFETGTMTEPPAYKVVYIEERKVDQFDIAIPILTPAIVRESRNIGNLTINKLEKKIIKRKKYKDDEIRNIIFIDALTKEKVDEHTYRMEYPKNPESVISFYTKIVLQQTKNTGQFATLYPLMRDYIQDVLFDEKVDLGDKQILKQLSEPETQQTVYDVFSDAINKLTLVEQSVESGGEYLKVSQANGFEWSGDVYDGEKQVFNLVACDNNYEVRFADFLEKSDDVIAYAKNNRYVHFQVEYLSYKGGMRYYYPDFLVKTRGGMFVVETKGLEDLEVARKDERMKWWCKDASKLTGQNWRYLKVLEDDFKKYQFKDFENIVSFLGK
ncbi:MAG: type III restriction enzyme [Parcubacteria group bacterium Gr01-1014_29]|nr:MAG: type III restriction enzyme [Parcubacteria group bacterium Gr01-1014_29]